MIFDTRTILALTIFGLFGLDMILWHIYPPVLDQAQAAIVNQLNGALIVVTAGVASFFFGSSDGSKKKDDALIAAAETPQMAKRREANVEPTVPMTVTVEKQELEAEIKP